jgi:hypothetical protein
MDPQYLEESVKETGVLVAKALYRYDPERAKKFTESLNNDNKSAYGYRVPYSALWGALLPLRNEDGLTTHYFRANTVSCGGFLTPIGHATALYLRDCFADNKEP